MRSRPALLLVVFLLASGCLTRIEYAVETPRLLEPLDTPALWNASAGGLVFEDETDWAEFWQRARPRSDASTPEVDLERSRVVGYVDELRQDTCYDLALNARRVRNGSIEIEARVSWEGPGCGTMMERNARFALLNERDAPISFVVRDETPD